MERLSKPQTTIFEMDRVGADSVANIAGDVFFHQEYSAGELVAAVKQLIEKCDILRTRVVMQDGVPMQHILPYVAEPIQLKSFDSITEYKIWAENQATTPVDIFGRLFRFMVVSVCGKCGVFCVLHHIIADAWSVGIIANRLHELLTTGTMRKIAPYQEYLDSEDTYIKSQRYEKDKVYWLSVYDANPEASYLVEKNATSRKSRRITFSLSEERSSQIRDYCAQNGISEYTVFMSAISAWFYRITGKERFYIGTPVLNRSTTVEKNTVGVLVDTVPLSVAVNEQDSFLDLCTSVSNGVFAAFRHQKFPYSELLKALRAERRLEGVLYDVMVSFQNVKVKDMDSTWYSASTITESLQIHIDDRAGSGAYQFEYDYQVDKFTEHSIRQIHSHILNLLTDGIFSPDRKLWQLDMLTDDERDTLLYAFNNTASDYPNGKCVHTLFEEQAKRTPDKLALVFENRSFTYRELDAVSNSLAHHLREKGVRPNDVVPIVATRSWHIIAAMLGVLKAGAAYMPVDPNYPLDRILYMFETANVRIALTYGYNGDLPLETVSLENFDFTQNTAPIESENKASDLCYIIFTSGSTGKPKGVCIRHQNVVNFCDNNGNNVCHSIVETNHQGIVSVTNIVFDIFVANDEEVLSQKKLSDLICRNSIDVMQTTPTKMRSYLLDKQNVEYLKKLNVIIMGGEVFPADLYRELRQYSNAEIYNIYGPAETTVWSTYKHIAESDYPRDKCIHTLFEEQVTRTPDKTALIACDRTLTYRELNEEANRIAHGLIGMGVHSGDLVAFMMPRTSKMIAVMLGILKSGAAYLPIDQKYPTERREYMMADSGAKLLITENTASKLTIGNSKNPNISMTSDFPCYCIYTSGTTGKPKGVLIKHQNVVNFCCNSKTNIISSIMKCDYVLASNSMVFDITLHEIHLPLLNGKTIFLTKNSEQILDSEASQIVASCNNLAMITTPTKIAMFLKDSTMVTMLQKCKTIMVGAEIFTSTLCEQIRAVTTAEIYNGYGPTETTCGSCYQNITASEITCYPTDKCIHTLFEEQVLRTPDKTALIASDCTLTYRELNKEANRISHGLMADGVHPGDLVAFMIPRTSKMIAVILGILKSGAAYLPIDPEYPLERREYMMADSGAKLLVTEKTVAKFEKITNISNPSVNMTSQYPCYCIYTSGSTGRPKGTVMHHKGIVNLINDQIIRFNLEAMSKYALLTTITFDVATQELFSTLLSGGSGYLLPEKLQMTAHEVANIIVNEQLEVLYATPSYFNLLTKDIRDAKAIMGQLKAIILAGEPFYLNENVLDLRERYPVIFENQYGPAETHVATTATFQVPPITIGKPIANTQIYIVDKHMNILPIGATGEICIAGDGVGLGYLNRPELTAEKFIDNPFGKGKLYKTGDLGRWLPNGEIDYVGRSDFQVKIRGLRIELGEIEAALQEQENITQAVVVVRKDESGRQYICAFYTGSEHPQNVLREALSKRLPRYMVPHVFTHIAAMPLTSSGKTDRKALPEVDLTDISSAVEYAAPVTEQEKAVVSAVREVLHTQKGGMKDNFFDLGGDSLKAIELTAALEQIGYRVEVRDIFGCGTLAELADKIAGIEKADEPAVSDEVIPATEAQMRVYTSQSITGGTAFNVPYAFRVKTLDPNRLQRAVSKMVSRYEILRTRFVNQSGRIIQIVEEDAACTVEKLDTDDVASFIRPFDLNTAPLLRVGYYNNTVMIDMHHIITDGSSMPIFLRELNELYMGRELSGKPVQYRFYAMQKKDHTESERYWLNVFADEPPVLEMNTDYPRESKQTFHGAALYETLPDSLCTQINTKCRELNLTPYAYYMGAFHILLSKFGGAEDLVVGLPTSGRHGKFTDAIGMFVNTVALRSRPEGSKTVAGFLREIRDTTVDILAHDDYSYGDLVKKLGLDTQTRNPLFDVMLAYQSEQMTDIWFGDEPVELLPIPISVAKYDFTFNVFPKQDSAALMVEYCTDLFKEQTIRRLIEAYELLLKQMLEEGKTLETLSPIPERERNMLLCGFNGTEEGFPRKKCVHQLFEEQVQRTPNRTAVIACDKTLTYQEMNAEANQIAFGLIGLGVRPGDIVAFALPRTSQMMVTIFGILKSGAAYLPIDLKNPKERVDYILEDSKARLCLTPDIVNGFLTGGEASNPNIEMSPDNPCYCIYTSGSTGYPKGTVIAHRNISNFSRSNGHSVTSIIKENKAQTIIGLASVGFDMFITESLFPVLNGMTILLADREQAEIPEKFYHIFDSNQVDILETTPSKMMLMLTAEDQRAKLNQLKMMILGGEEVDSTLVKVLRKYTKAKIYNFYGPTECTVWATYGLIKNDDDFTIGKPMANTQVYIVNKRNEIQPIGVTGELCIAGACVGLGYLNRPEMTAERFIDNPFGEGKLYKTGDLAYWREDGEIVYVGRNDFQVKIRGLRIELGEIESALQEMDSVRQAVVVVRKNEEGRQLICAFYTGKETDGKTLRSYLGQRLPKYMIPHIFTYLDAMPLTASGKINRKMLPEVDLTQIGSTVEHMAPQGEKEIRLASLMEQVLAFSPIGRNDDFFDLGGDSLKAIELISEAQAAGMEIKLQDVYDHPNIAELVKYVNLGERERLVRYSSEQFTELMPLLQGNIIDDYIPEAVSIGNLLLTGATGFLGAHVLEVYLRRNVGDVWCIVRGVDQQESEHRLEEILTYYFGGEYVMHNKGRIHVLCGDLQEARFSLRDQQWQRLCNEITTIIHSAASVKHYGTYAELYNANVVTTKNILAFAKASGARLLHISTTSISGAGVSNLPQDAGKVFSETDLYIGQGLDNVYVHSKFEAELEVLRAMNEGIPANILRMGNLSNRFSDGKFQPNYQTNAMLKRIRAFIGLGVFPEYMKGHSMEFTPVDEAAEAVMEIAEHFNMSKNVFHVENANMTSFDTLVKYLQESGMPAKWVSENDFTSALRQSQDDPKRTYIMEALVNDVDSNKHFSMFDGIQLSTEFTANYLHRLGFSWSQTDQCYFRRYLDYFSSLHFWGSNN